MPLLRRSRRHGRGIRPRRFRTLSSGALPLAQALHVKIGDRRAARRCPRGGVVLHVPTRAYHAGAATSINATQAEHMLIGSLFRVVRGLGRLGGRPRRALWCCSVTWSRERGRSECALSSLMVKSNHAVTAYKRVFPSVLRHVSGARVICVDAVDACGRLRDEEFMMFTDRVRRCWCRLLRNPGPGMESVDLVAFSHETRVNPKKLVDLRNERE
jgi:hypothetical protein